MRMVLLLVGLSLLNSTVTLASDPHYPKLFFRYSFLFDQVCSPNNPVKPDWAKEATQREPEFTSLWEKEAPTLFGQLFKDFKRGYSRNELTATLSVCPGSPPFSEPLVLNVVPYLKSFMDPRPVYSDYKFVDTVFHELLHTWLVENFSFNSPLLKKYAKENQSVRVHLHLMAIQKLIYLELGRQDLLTWLPAGYAEIGGDYARAWEIVDQLEGYEVFISEIKSDLVVQRQRR